MNTIKELQKIIHNIAKEKGFWDEDRNDGELLMLIVSELGEALEALRKDDLDNFSEELADVAIRLFDLAEGRGIDLETAILKKIEINKQRPYKHGKKF